MHGGSVVGGRGSVVGAWLSVVGTSGRREGTNSDFLPEGGKTRTGREANFLSSSFVNDSWRTYEPRNKKGFNTTI